MATNKLSSGSQLPEITLSLVAGGEVTLGKPQKEGNWKLIFIYRGLHCPLCKGYLQKLESLKDKFLAIGAEIIAIPGDPEAKALSMAESTGLSTLSLMG
jgi:peroxiredoxin